MNTHEAIKAGCILKMMKSNQLRVVTHVSNETVYWIEYPDGGRRASIRKSYLNKKLEAVVTRIEMPWKPVYGQVEVKGRQDYKVNKEFGRWQAYYNGFQIGPSAVYIGDAISIAEQHYAKSQIKPADEDSLVQVSVNAVTAGVLTYLDNNLTALPGHMINGMMEIVKKEFIIFQGKVKNDMPKMRSGADNKQLATKLG